MSKHTAPRDDAGRSYIVRIYRCASTEEPGRRRQDAVELIGTVEDAQAGERQGFHNIETLWTILSGNTPPQRPHQRGKGG